MTFSPRSSARPLIVAAAALLFTSGGCVCVRDVTNNASYPFAVVKNHRYATKAELLVYQSSRPDDRGAAIELYLAGDGPGGTAMPTAIAPPGTVIRPVQVVGEFCESGSIWLYAMIETGPYAGRKAKVQSDALFNPLSAHSPMRDEYRWEANPEYLQEVK